MVSTAMATNGGSAMKEIRERLVGRSAVGVVDGERDVFGWPAGERGA
jgi:hypothetical protein